MRSMRVCSYCRRPFDRRAHARADQRYCTDDCRKRAWYERGQGAADPWIRLLHKTRRGAAQRNQRLKELNGT